MKNILEKIKGDKTIWMVVFLLSFVSIIAVYSSVSTLVYQANGNSFKFLFKHTLLIGLGFLVMYMVHKMNFKYFGKVSQVLIWLAGGLLLFTLLFGLEINDAKRWLNVPLLNLTFQPSDFAKIVLVVYVAHLLYVKRTVLHNFKEGVLPILLPIGAICALILPANFSTAALLGFTCMLLMYIGGVAFKHLAGVVGTAVVAMGLLISTAGLFPETGVFKRLQTWQNRCLAWVTDDAHMESNKNANYQIEYAKVAIYHGGLFPHGPATGTARNFLPAPYSDMIFAFIIEEYGSLLGGGLLIFLYLIFLRRCLLTARKSPHHFGGLMVVGLSVMLVLQALVNMAVAVNLFPTTGQPLPLVSMGGTSIIFTCLAIGLILSVSRAVYDPEGYKYETSKGKNRPKMNKNSDHAIA